MATKLFVGGLSWDTTDESLKSFFSSAGTVVSANVIKDKYTGRSRGFGFVEMSSDAEAEEAKKLNGQALDGRNITVNDARPQEAGEGGGYAKPAAATQAPSAKPAAATQAPSAKADEPEEEVEEAEEKIEEVEEKVKEGVEEAADKTKEVVEEVTEEEEKKK